MHRSSDLQHLLPAGPWSGGEAILSGTVVFLYRYSGYACVWQLKICDKLDLVVPCECFQNSINQCFPNCPADPKGCTYSFVIAPNCWLKASWLVGTKKKLCSIEGPRDWVWGNCNTSFTQEMLVWKCRKLPVNVAYPIFASHVSLVLPIFIAWALVQSSTSDKGITL